MHRLTFGILSVHGHKDEPLMYALSHSLTTVCLRGRSDIPITSLYIDVVE